MTKEEITGKVQEIFRDIFDEPTLVISGEMTADDVDAWDSLNHINLISAIEKEFKIHFALGELQKMKNVDVLIEMVMKKLGLA